MARLLNLLERQVDLIGRGLPPDLELLKEIAVFFRCFPDFCHHPKEDLVIRAIAERDPEAGRSLQRLVAEHESGCEELQQFSRALITMLLEPAKAPVFVDVARRFLESERRHMAYEDGPFFEIAETTLDENDWAELTKRFAPLVMPDFEIQSRLRFDRLDAELARWRA